MRMSIHSSGVHNANALNLPRVINLKNLVTVFLSYSLPPECSRVTKHICPSVVECLSFCPYIVKRQSARPSVRCLSVRPRIYPSIRCLSVLRQHMFMRNLTTVRPFACCLSVYLSVVERMSFCPYIVKRWL